MAQWEITKYGIESHENKYEIPWNRLHEAFTVRGEVFYMWPMQMAGKRWIDIDDFCAKFIEAAKDKRAPEMDLDKVIETTCEAISIVRNRRGEIH